MTAPSAGSDHVHEPNLFDALHRPCQEGSS